MTGYVVLFIVSAVGLVLSVLRYQAGQARRSTTARLEAEAADGGIPSPTEELFRAEGVPIPAAMRDGLSTAPPPSSQKIGPMLKEAAQSARQGLGQGIGQLRESVGPLLERTDLDALVAGVHLPCELAPMVDDQTIADGSVRFVTSIDRTPDLRDELHTAFARIGCSVRWNDDANASIARGPYSGELGIGPVSDRIDLVGVTIRAT